MLAPHLLAAGSRQDDQGWSRPALVLHGPFETIELNAPGGIGDYCARYGPSHTRIADECHGGDPFGKDNVGRILAEWGDSPTPETVKTVSDWRDTRLAALKAHKRQAKAKPKPQTKSKP